MPSHSPAPAAPAPEHQPAISKARCYRHAVRTQAEAALLACSGGRSQPRPALLLLPLRGLQAAAGGCCCAAIAAGRDAALLLLCVLRMLRLLCLLHMLCLVARQGGSAVDIRRPESLQRCSSLQMEERLWQRVSSCRNNPNSGLGSAWLQNCPAASESQHVGNHCQANAKPMPD